MFRFRRKVYLDNNATTPIHRQVRRRICRVLAGSYGNPSSLYRIARDAAEILEESRRTVAATVGAEAEEIIFTGSASEANNQVLKTLLSLSSERNKVISSPIEHPSVMETLDYLAEQGLQVEFCPLDREGGMDMQALRELLDERTLALCCMAANNEIGVVQDIAAVAGLAKGHGALVISDCVQALGKIPLDVKALGVDYAVFSAHKIQGPKGVGALYVREGAPLKPLIHGGHQEGGLRAGTEGLHNIAGFAAACARVDKLLAASQRVHTVQQRLRDGIQALLPSVRFNSPQEGGLSNTLNVTFPGFDNAEMLAFLDYRGIGASAGSACNTGANTASHVLKAIGLSDEEARQTLRFSLCSETSTRQIDYALGALGDILQRRKLPVLMVSPRQLDETMLYNENLFIVDIRHGYDRKLLAGLPNSHEAKSIILKKYLHAIPKDKEILVVCQGGTDGPVAAYYLRSKGYRRVSFVMGGLVGWKLFQPALYRKLAGSNVSQLQEA
jgi:cysteine desulfurase